MGLVINKNTLYVVKSANTPDYDEDAWIINPDLPDCAKKYWKIVDDEVLEMSEDEKTAVDTTESTQVLKNQLSSTDNSMIRGVDDLIDLLIAKGTITLSDLPDNLKTKYNYRKDIRGSL